MVVILGTTRPITEVVRLAMSLDYMGIDDNQAMEYIEKMIEKEPGKGRDAFKVFYDIQIYLTVHNIRGNPLQRLRAAYRAVTRGQ